VSVSPTLISSLQNPRVKKWRNFQKPAFRRQSDEFFVEGLLECKRGIDSIYHLSELILCRDILDKAHYQFFVEKIKDPGILVEVSRAVYEKIAYRGDSEGVIGIFLKDESTLESLVPPQNSPGLFLIVENVEKPGNLGAILRTADALNTTAIIMTGKGTDQYNPNVTRASLGTIFSVPVFQTSNENLVLWASKLKIPLFCAALPAFSNLYELEFPQIAGFVFGAEHQGLSEFWIKGDFTKFTIPMHGIADSLNLSVSVAVTGYEFLRRFSIK
jgi:TrmH family RNA methyltransferase